MITRLQTWVLYDVPLITVTYDQHGKMIGSFPYDINDDYMAFNDVMDYCEQSNDLGIDCHIVNRAVWPFEDDSSIRYEDMYIEMEG